MLMLIAQGLLAQFVPGRDPTVVRKNIDKLTEEELESYEFALKVMKERSDKNPYDKTGFAWQAWVHNKTDVTMPESVRDQKKFNRSYFDSLRRWNHVRSDRDYYEWVAGLNSDFFEKNKIDSYITANPGKCEHGTEMFLLWHRGEFYYFEQIIREILVKNNKPLVGVPYWNYTQPPSGKRYPKAFEKEKKRLLRFLERSSFLDFLKGRIGLYFHPLLDFQKL